MGTGRRHRTERARLRDLLRSRPRVFRRHGERIPARARATSKSGTTSSWSSCRHPDGPARHCPAECRYWHGSRAADDDHAGRRSIYDTDLYQDIIQRAGDAGRGHVRRRSTRSDLALRVIADHARGATFLIADGVLPGNEGRSYILRRILRRAIRHGRQLGLTKPFLAEMASVVIGQFASDYPAICASGSRRSSAC